MSSRQGQFRERSLIAHLVWGLLGVVAVPALWFVWSLPGAIVMFGAIASAFILWYTLGPRGSWMALIVIGLGMGGILGWQAATGSRCPQNNGKVYMRLDRPPVDCKQIKASAASLSIFFFLVAGLGLGAPLYARSVEGVEE